MDYSNLRKGVATRGAVFNDATTKLIGRVCSNNRASTTHDLATRSAAGNRKSPSLRRMISPPVTPTHDGFRHHFGHLFPQMRVVRFDRA
jgi:hypothetical protein